MNRNTVGDIYQKYYYNEQIIMLTAYDATFAGLIDTGDVDMILVGDSAGYSQLGFESSIPVSLEQALSNTAAVDRVAETAMVVGDLPFLSYGLTIEDSVRSAGRFMKEAGADAVKLETVPGGETTVKIVERLTELEIPTMGHITVPSGSTDVRAAEEMDGSEYLKPVSNNSLLTTAKKLEKAGAFSLVLEPISERTAKEISDEVDIPTVGFGTGGAVDGQVLLINDLLGLSADPSSFTKQYVDLSTTIRDAVQEFVTEVRNGTFPDNTHTYDPID